MRALSWFRDAGLMDTSAQTFVGDAYAPLTDNLRSALLALFRMCWPGVESEIGQEDWEPTRASSKQRLPTHLPDVCIRRGASHDSVVRGGTV